MNSIMEKSPRFFMLNESEGLKLSSLDEFIFTWDYADLLKDHGMKYYLWSGLPETPHIRDFKRCVITDHKKAFLFSIKYGEYLKKSYFVYVDK